jgi:hypothetical protein
MGRDGRRRRVLNEEARSASAVRLAASGAGADADAPRYGELASIEHHPQITDYIPRRTRTVLVALGAGLSVAAGAQALVHFAEPIAEALPGVSADEVASRVAGGVAAWAAALALLLSAALGRIVFSLRRHRVGDVRGRYRVWRWITIGAVAMSVNAIVGGHELLAAAARAATGWSLTSSGAEWWLTPCILAGGWIGMRLLLEVAESRASAALVVAAAACYGLGAAGALGWSPEALGAWSGAVAGAMPLAGHTFALAALAVFARYVVLDVQGLVDHAPRRVQRPARKKAAVETDRDESPATAEPARPAIAARITPPADQEHDDDQWSDDDEGHDVRRLSKAERKRLRKQGRAA